MQVNNISASSIPKCELCKREIDQLRTLHDTLTQKYSHLVHEHEQKVAENEQLRGDYITLRADHDALRLENDDALNENLLLADYLEDALKERCVFMLSCKLCFLFT